jgi:hypothetical protein
MKMDKTKNDLRGDTKMAAQWVRSHDVVWEEIDGEAVLVSTAVQKTWVLNATASLIWKCCDGTISLETLARRIAGGCGREAGRVKAELVEFCREMEQRGLLMGVRAAGAISGDQLSSTLCFSGMSVPPMIKMESLTVGIRGKPSPRGVCGQ